MDAGGVVARRGRVWIALAWFGPVLVGAFALGMFVTGLASGSTFSVVLSAPTAAFAAFLVSEATEQIQFRDDEIVVRRPPMRSLRIPIQEVTAIEKFTPTQWFVRSRGRSRPLTITFKWLENEAEVQGALEELAARHHVPLLETDMFKDTAT